MGLDIRLKELGAVQSRIEEFLKEKGKKSNLLFKNSELILKRRPRLSDHSGLSRISIFEYLTNFEESIGGITASTTTEKGGTQASPRIRPAQRSANDILKRLTRSAADKGPDSIEALARELFNDLNEFILMRQESVASGIMNWRNHCVKSWGAILDENPNNRL